MVKQKYDELRSIGELHADGKDDDGKRDPAGTCLRRKPPCSISNIEEGKSDNCDLTRIKPCGFYEHNALHRKLLAGNNVCSAMNGYIDPHRDYHEGVEYIVQFDGAQLGMPTSQEGFEANSFYDESDGKCERTEFTKCESKCYEILMYAGECWGEAQLVLSGGEDSPDHSEDAKLARTYDCMGTCGTAPGCAEHNGGVVGYASDCLRYRVCHYMYEEAKLEAPLGTKLPEESPDCADELTDMEDDAALTAAGLDFMSGSMVAPAWDVKKPRASCDNGVQLKYKETRLLCNKGSITGFGQLYCDEVAEDTEKFTALDEEMEAMLVAMRPVETIPALANFTTTAAPGEAAVETGAEEEGSEAGSGENATEGGDGGGGNNATEGGGDGGNATEGGSGGNETETAEGGGSEEAADNSTEGYLFARKRGAGSGKMRDVAAKTSRKPQQPDATAAAAPEEIRRPPHFSNPDPQAGVIRLRSTENKAAKEVGVGVAPAREAISSPVDTAKATASPSSRDELKRQNPEEVEDGFSRGKDHLHHKVSTPLKQQENDHSSSSSLNEKKVLVKNDAEASQLSRRSSENKEKKTTSVQTDDDKAEETEAANATNPTAAADTAAEASNSTEGDTASVDSNATAEAAASSAATASFDLQQNVTATASFDLDGGGAPSNDTAAAGAAFEENSNATAAINVSATWGEGEDVHVEVEKLAATEKENGANEVDTADKKTSKKDDKEAAAPASSEKDESEGSEIKPKKKKSEAEDDKEKTAAGSEGDSASADEKKSSSADEVPKLDTSQDPVLQLVELAINYAYDKIAGIHPIANATLDWLSGNVDAENPQDEEFGESQVVMHEAALLLQNEKKSLSTSSRRGRRRNQNKNETNETAYDSAASSEDAATPEESGNVDGTGLEESLDGVYREGVDYYGTNGSGAPFNDTSGGTPVMHPVDRQHGTLIGIDGKGPSNGTGLFVREKEKRKENGKNAGGGGGEEDDVQKRRGYVGEAVT
ncbi:unnamed protein product [Amoebophrya sp. A120]|nr:unnamed protein product [Amoebophrya sp. A120]|eukprot:GSA120T00015938001.1